MQIFMDESGTFVPDKGLAVVSALVVPDHQIAGLEKLYKRLRRSLPKERGEVKGRLLAEREVAAVAEIARKVGCLLETTAIDMTDNTAADVEDHRGRQVAAMALHITDEHHENVRNQIARLQEQLRAMPLQLYVQAAVMGHVIHVLLRHTSVYFALRDGRELGSYAWVIDAKGKEEKITPWEKWWLTVITPMLESKSFREPGWAIEGGDYRFEEKFLTEPSEWKRQFTNPTDRSRYLDISAILKTNFRFSADAEIGLEIVDILANATRRALTGKLAPEGYLSIRRLMIHRRHHYISLIALHEREISGRKAYNPIMGAFSSGGRLMLTAGSKAKP
jgi:hypothetical protein